MRRKLTLTVERFPIAGRFTISRGSKTEAVVVLATIEQDGRSGRGECVPYQRYGESIEGVLAAIEAMRGPIESGLTREALQTSMPAGAARNALDCALWDLEAKLTGVPVHVLAGLDRLRPATTAYTLSLDTPDAMGAAARAASERPILKIKLGADENDAERLAAIRQAAPDALLIIDANEGWRADDLAAHLATCARFGVALIEQPLPAADDTALEALQSPIPICADESLHQRADLPRIAARYDAINIKLDKTGGLTEALALAREASALNLKIMVGCMVGSSLAMAPAMLLTPFAQFVDLDGPLLLARDRDPGLRYDGSIIHPPQPALWG